MVIEFGYVTLFASAFPLASCISVFCNLIEIKSDCYKLTHALQRPPAERVNSIGVWGGVLQVMMLLSIVTNASLFAFSSEQMAAWFPDLFRTVDSFISSFPFPSMNLIVAFSFGTSATI